MSDRPFEDRPLKEIGLRGALWGMAAWMPASDEIQSNPADPDMNEEILAQRTCGTFLPATQLKETCRYRGFVAPSGHENPLAAYIAARIVLCSFAQLERSPKSIHTYRITPLSLWNAAGSCVTVNWSLEGLDRFSHHPVPKLVHREIREQSRRFGRAALRPWSSEYLLLRVDVHAVRPILHVHLRPAQRCRMVRGHPAPRRLPLYEFLR